MFRSFGVISVLALALALFVVAPQPARAAGCLAGTYCGSLNVTISGFGPGTWMTTDAAGVPDGVMSCYYGGALSPVNCNHKFEWDRVSTKTIYWKVSVPPISKVAGAGSGSTTLTSATTTNTAVKFDYAYPMEVRATVTGSGTVTSTPAGLNCGSTCVWSYNVGAPEPITVTIVPDPGWTVASVVGPAVSCPPPPITTCVIVKAMYQSSSFAVAFQPLATPAPTPVPTVAPTATAVSAAVVATPTPTKKGGKPAGTTNLAGGAEGPVSGPAFIFLATLLGGSLLWVARSRRKRHT